MTTITSRDLLKDVSIGGTVTLVKRASEFGLKSGTVVIYDGTYTLPDGPRFQYHTKGSKADPLPPVVTPPASAILATLSPSGEAFLQSDTLSIGFNAHGGIGTLYPAPEGHRTDKDSGLLRVGMYPTGRDDIVLQGRAIEGPGAIIDGRTYANMPLTGYSQIPGAWNDPHLWTGQIAGVAFTQRVALSGNALSVLLTARNATDKPIAIRLLRSFDPDQSDRYATTQTVIAPGAVEAKLQGGGSVVMRDPDGKAAVCHTTYGKAATIGVPFTTVRTADDVMQLVWPQVVLAPGTSVTAVVEYAVG